MPEANIEDIEDESSIFELAEDFAKYAESKTKDQEIGAAALHIASIALKSKAVK